MALSTIFRGGLDQRIAIVFRSLSELKRLWISRLLDDKHRNFKMLCYIGAAMFSYEKGYQVQGDLSIVFDLDTLLVEERHLWQSHQFRKTTTYSNKGTVTTVCQSTNEQVQTEWDRYDGLKLSDGPEMMRPRVVGMGNDVVIS